MIPGASPIIAGAKYRARAVNFDGSSAFLTRASDFTGAVDGPAGTMSFWIKFNSGDGSEKYIFSSQNARTRVLRQASGKIGVGMLTSGGTNIVPLTSATSVTADGLWHHVIISWNRVSSPPLSTLYLDGVLDASFSNLTGSVDYTDSTYAIGARRTANDELLPADLAEFWFCPDYFDLSVSANLQKFRSASGKPVSLGADGSAPSGVQPFVYLQGPASGFANNLGSGGAFTVNGTLTDSTTSPSD